LDCFDSERKDANKNENREKREREREIERERERERERMQTRERRHGTVCVVSLLYYQRAMCFLSECQASVEI